MPVISVLYVYSYRLSIGIRICEQNNFMSISGQLREAIKNSGETAYAIAKKTNVPQPTIFRFMEKGAEMRTENIDRLAEYFGLELQPTKKPAPKTRKKK